ncbi:MAG: two-component regulator propeller domain-containing protein [Candidatus Pedobacter colombiensis]|uniref:histidine kinase n=1 Tax=Candidatus Pedobacter colombiensis TaxID=3121371 RepID=A0AAJ5WAB5_9SPHI|nr:hybrid sensor histidine kinase/response regulator transcription factor [Pedobacter sp.]WEK20931.1 MAG: two-component regulator propeller domain-containing protein [Pedobacter sp.]
MIKRRFTVGGKLIWMLLLIVMVGKSMAQAPVKIERYSTEDGLSHDIITCMFKDKQGYMWFGTWNGINRFDGHTFTSFTSMPGDMSQIGNDRVDQIFEDAANHLWIKSYDGEVYRFDKGKEQFTSVSAILGLKEKILFDRILSCEDGMLWVSTINHGLLLITDVSLDHSGYRIFSSSSLNDAYLPSDQTNFFFRSNKNTYWVGTAKGLVRLSKNAAGVFTSKQLNLGKNAVEEFTAVTASDGKLYFGTSKGDLIVFDAKSGKYQCMNISHGRLNAMLPSRKNGHIYMTSGLGELINFDPGTSMVSTSKYNIPDALFSIFEDSSGQLWIEPEKRGIVRYDVNKRVFQTFVQKNDAINVIPHSHFKVFEDKNGTVWSILRDGGFGFYDEKAGRFSYFYNEPASPQRLMSNLATVVFYDPAGVMWLHTDQRRLEKIIFHPNNFKQQLLVDPGVFKSQNEVRGLFSDSKNRLWVGAKSGLLYIYENEKLANVTFEHLPKGGLGMVYAIFQAKDGTIWMGTKDNGLYSAEPLDDQQTHYRLSHYMHNQADNTSISSNQVYSITEDNWGRIWVGTFDKGLNMLDVGQIKPVFQRFYDKANGYPGRFHKIRYLTIDGHGRLWIGSTDGLVIGEALKTGRMKFTTYSKQPGNIQSLGNNDIQYMLKDHANRMWLATSGGGLNLALEKPGSDSLTFKVYSTKNGLSNNYMLSIGEDKQHRLWMATKSSLTRFDPQNEKFNNFNSYDGVPNDGFSEASCQLTQDGKMVFGTTRGMLSFDPEQVKYHPIHSNMAFTGLQINNTDVSVGAGSLLKQNINNTKDLVLKYNQNTISIDYTVLDFRSGNRQRYLYRLKGFDSTWHDNKNQRRATYTNLPPGEYVLAVKSPDSDNYSSIPSKELKITILPPLWKTWWAYLIYFLLFCIAVEITRRIAVTFLRLRQGIAVEQKMTALKMAFFTNVSHELRTPLTLILNPVDALLQKEELSNQGKEYASIVRRNAVRMVRFVNQLLDLRKAQSGQSKLKTSRIELIGFVEEIAADFKEAAKTNQIELKVTGDRPVFVEVDADKMETVIYNLLSNSFKFSDTGKRIEIIISKSYDAMHIVVNDEGSGVNEADLENIFLLYHESEHPNTQQLKGTGIGLALARELVELHGGKIFASNRQQRGLSVTITLPIAKTDMHTAVKKVGPLIALETEVRQPPAIAEEQAQQSDKQLVLLVEDNEDMRSFLSANLGGTYRIKTAVDGLEGFALAKKIQPDLILSDIMMPKMDGITMLDHLKNDQATSHIPVILLSAKSAVESQVVGLRYGADYYISKPFDNELLFAALANILAQRKRIVERLVSKEKVIELGPGQIVVTSKDEVFLQKVIAIVEEHMTDPQFNIDAVAEMVNMARATFFKKFKSLTQQAPVEFIRDMRLKRAKQYLDAGMGNITEIAYSVGFSSAKYFSTCFRVYYGISPSDYLKTTDALEGKNAKTKNQIVNLI